MMRLLLDPNSIEDYRTFLNVKSLPTYGFEGRTATFPDEYADRMGIRVDDRVFAEYAPHPSMFDYQADITKLAITKERYCIFADCGLGKTLMLLDYARHVAEQLPHGRCVLIISPLMVIEQTIAESRAFYGDRLPIAWVRASELQDFLDHGSPRIGIVNYDALSKPIRAGRLGALVLDESSMLKSHYGKWGTQCIELGKGLRWKLACTGTPAPNDRIEYANHAVFMDAFPTVNSFLARYFVNRGQTDERWELKKHALAPFYRQLSHWCIFLSNPAVYGWHDNTEPLPAIEVNMHHVALTDEQQTLVYEKTGSLIQDKIGGIQNRSVLSQISKGSFRGKKIESLKPAVIRELVDSWPTESTIVWCLYNAEQHLIEEVFPEAASLHGETPYAERRTAIDDFKSGKRRILISKPKVLGFGLNLQKCTRMVFSGLQDSYESYYQCIKRANRYGANHPLNVHIPYTDAEYPMITSMLRKAAMVQSDTNEQERIFKAVFNVGAQ